MFSINTLYGERMGRISMKCCFFFNLVLLCLSPLACSQHSSDNDKTHTLQQTSPDATYSPLPSLSSHNTASLDRLCNMTVEEKIQRLKSFTYTENSDYKALRADDEAVVHRIKTKAEINSLLEFSLESQNNTDHEKSLILFKENLFLKNNQGQWRKSHDPAGTAVMVLEDSLGGIRSLCPLIMQTAVLKPAEEAQYAGISTERFSFQLQNKTLTSSSPDMLWLSKAMFHSGQGVLDVDKKSGVLIHVQLDAVLKVLDQDKPATIQIIFDAGIQNIGKTQSISPPTQSIDDLVRTKYLVDFRKSFESKGLIPPLPIDSTSNKKSTIPSSSTSTSTSSATP